MILAICNNKVCKLYNGYDSFHCWFYMFPECIIRHYFGTRTDDLTQVNFVGQNQCICFLLINKTNREHGHWLSSSLYCYTTYMCSTDNEWSCIIYLHSYELEEAVSCIYTGKKPRIFVPKIHWICCRFPGNHRLLPGSWPWLWLSGNIKKRCYLI